MAEQKASDEEEKPKNYGVKLSKITLPLFRDIVQIYDTTVGANHEEVYDVLTEYDRHELESTKKALRNSGMAQWRWGAKGNHEAKLYFSREEIIYAEDGSTKDLIVRIHFDPNDDDLGTSSPESKLLINTFKERIEEHLKEKGLRTELRE